MGSLHCARICMDVIAAVIGRFRSRPASQPRSPRLADSAAPGPPPPPPPGTKRPGRGGGAGLGSRGRRGRGGVLHCVLQAGVEDLGAGRQLGLNLQVEVSQVVGKQAGKPGIGSPEVGEDVLGGSHDVSVPPAPRFCNTHARRGEGPNGQEKEDAERPREARSRVISLQLLILQIRLAP